MKNLNKVILSDETERRAIELCDLRQLGRGVQEMSYDVLRKGNDTVISRWFHSKEKADLFVWQDDRGNIIRQQVLVYGQVVEWNIIEGVKTGMQLDFEADEDSRDPEIRFDDTPHAATLSQALEFISHMTSVRDGLRDALYDNFIKSPKASEMDPREFVDQFGPPPGKGETKQVAPAGFLGFVRSVLKRLGFVLSKK